jgi:cytochrome c biogenesis protein CcmG, thiol:disulfide interchange protein DsbE
MSVRPVAALFAVLLIGGALALGPGRPFVSEAAHALGLRHSPPAARPGAAFPDLALTNLDGSPASLRARGTVVYNVFTSWCPSCNAELPDLLSVQPEFRKRGITFIGIDQGEPAGRVAAFVAQRGIQYPVLLDASNITTSLLGARVIPETLIVRNGTVARIFVGPMTAAELKQAVQDV